MDGALPPVASPESVRTEDMATGTSPTLLYNHSLLAIGAQDPSISGSSRPPTTPVLEDRYRPRPATSRTLRRMGRERFRADLSSSARLEKAELERTRVLRVIRAKRVCVGCKLGTCGGAGDPGHDPRIARGRVTFASSATQTEDQTWEELQGHMGGDLHLSWFRDESTNGSALHHADHGVSTGQDADCGTDAARAKAAARTAHLVAMMALQRARQAAAKAETAADLAPVVAKAFAQLRKHGSGAAHTALHARIRRNSNSQGARASSSDGLGGDDASGTPTVAELMDELEREKRRNEALHMRLSRYINALGHDGEVDEADSGSARRKKPLRMPVLFGSGGRSSDKSSLPGLGDDGTDGGHGDDHHASTPQSDAEHDVLQGELTELQNSISYWRSAADGDGGLVGGAGGEHHVMDADHAQALIQSVRNMVARARDTHANGAGAGAHGRAITRADQGTQTSVTGHAGDDDATPSADALSASAKQNAGSTTAASSSSAPSSSVAGPLPGGTGLSKLKGMKKPGKAMPLINTCTLIGNIYDAKVQAEEVDRREGNEPQELPRFCEQYLLQRFGLKSVAMKHLRNLIASIKAYAKENRRCWQFAMLAGIEVPKLDDDHKLPPYFSQATSFFCSLLARMYGKAGKGPDDPMIIPNKDVIAKRLKEVKDVYIEKSKVIEAARAMYRPVVLDMLMSHFDTNAAACPKHPKTHAEQVEVDHILRMCMDAWPREVGEEVHESEVNAALSVQRVFRLGMIMKQSMRLLRAARQQRQVEELRRVFDESDVLSADAAHVFDEWQAAIHHIDPVLDHDRCAELFDLALELAAAKEGIDYDADEDEDREPTLSSDIFIEAMQAYGYRYNVFNKWERDHHMHTEYVIVGTGVGSKIVEKNTQQQWANQRRASLCNVNPIIHDD